MLGVYLALVLAGKRTAGEKKYLDRETIPERFRAEIVEILLNKGLDENGEPLK